MSSETLLINNNKLLNDSHETSHRICFMCFSPIPSKKAFKNTNLFRLLACDNCYKDCYKENK